MQVKTPAMRKPISFDEVVEAYWERIYNLTYRIMASPEEAEDLTQETFIHAFQAYDRFRGESQVFTWLYRIAVNLCKNRLRQIQRIREVETDSLDAMASDENEGEMSKEIEDMHYAPEVLVERQELQEAIQKSIASLTEEQRIVVVLREIEELSYEEIANIVGCSVEAVRSRLSRARTQLRKKLRRYLES